MDEDLEELDKLEEQAESERAAQLAMAYINAEKDHAQ